MSARITLAGAAALAFVLAGCESQRAEAIEVPASAVGVDLRLDKSP